MAVLTAAKRKKLPESSFAISEKDGYPIHDEAHARNALARVKQHGTAEEQRRVIAAVRRRYPGIEVETKPARAQDGAVVGLTREKACQILEDGQVNGTPLSDAQRRLMGAVCSGQEIRRAANGAIVVPDGWASMWLAANAESDFDADLAAHLEAMEQSA